MKYFLSLFILIIIEISNLSKAYQLYIPRGNTKEVNISQSVVTGNKTGVFETIAFVNNYLWLAIGFLCFIFLIINGIKMIIDRGATDITKKSLKSLMGSVVGIVICILSYSAVRMIVNLFG